MEASGLQQTYEPSTTSFGLATGSLGGSLGGSLESLSEQPLNSGEFLENGKQIKARKPYTITKSRERWSEEEHQRFVEAVRLHGRAWRKIEDHIGTKTAVQIRSHAQKFFNKLEKKKEAGELPEEDISIPPPRPKRKPSKPYPRKDGVSSSGLTGTSQLQTSSQMPASSSLAPGLHAALQQALLLQQQQQYGVSPSMGMEGLLHNFDSLTTASSLASGRQQQQQQLPHQQQQQQQHLQQQQPHPGEVTDATVAAVTAAASAAAAAAAAAVVAAAGQEVQMYMQAHPPSCFPFFGLPPSAFAQLSPVAPALDQAVTAAEHVAAATAAAYRFGGSAAAEAAAEAAAAAPAVAAAAAAAAAAGEDEDMAGVEDIGAAGDRNLVEATGTTDGTHVSANAQLRGSDGDSACSRETDSQDPDADDADVTMDATWQDKLQEQQQQQQQHGLPVAANPAARGLAGWAEGALGPLAGSQWGLGALGGPDAGGAMAAVSQMLSALAPAQVMALLSNPLYLAAVNQQLSQQAAATAAAGPQLAPNNHQQLRQQQPSGMDRSNGGAAGTSARTKSRHNAPSVNSGSTGPPVGTKRGHPADAGEEEQAAQAAKKVAREARECEYEAMEASPGSPSIQEKHLKTPSSQPSTTNGNTSGSNESDASKRRQGTTQGEGSNPSVKDSNTATHTNGCSGNGSGSGKAHTNGNGTNGNGTSAFHPLGHPHHSHAHSHQHNGHAARRPKAHTSSAPPAAVVKGPNFQHHHHHHHHSCGAPGAVPEGSNGGNGMSGTNNGMSGTNNNTSGTNGSGSGRDEGRSSSDLDGPTQQQQLLQRHPHMQQAQQAAEEDTAGGQLQEGQAEQQGNPAAAQLQALLSSLHGMCGASPMMQTYGTAAAAAAQHMLASALHDLPGPEMQQQQQQSASVAGPQLLAALQQQLAQAGVFAGQQQQQQVLHAHAAGSQGFSPWHADASQGVAGFAGASFNVKGTASMLGAAVGLEGMRQQDPARTADAAATAQLAAAAAGLMGLGEGSWGGAAAAAAGIASSTGVGAPSLPVNPFTKLTSSLQQQQQRSFNASAADADSAYAAVMQAAGSSGQAAVAAAAAQQQQLHEAANGQQQRQALGPSLPAAAAVAAAALGRFPQLSGLELLSRAAQSAGAVGGSDEAGTGGSSGRQARPARSSDQAAPCSRKPTTTL